LKSQFWTAPNQLTLLRLVFIPLILVCIVDQHWRWALALFLLAGASDGIDGLLARMLQQRTLLGEYLDPIADKLLLSTLFVQLSVAGKIPWRVTVLVFTRDLFILIVCALLYAIANMRDFRPSIFGKLNTLAQIVTVFFTLVAQVHPAMWIRYVRRGGLWATIALTILSGVHYSWRTSMRLRQGERRTVLRRPA
jgi:cardiolipin synthase (CMP-forming)